MKRATAVSRLGLLGLVGLVAGVACTPAIDPARIAAVQVVGTESAVRGCRLLGQIEGIDTDRWVPGGPSYEAAMLDLRKKAVAGGGNYLVTDRIQSPSAGDYNPLFAVRARLFACEANHTEGARVEATRPPEPARAQVPAASGQPLMPPLMPPEPSQPARPPAPPPPATAMCEPDCSPGYTCLRGTCVSACNPLCSGGERCGTNRLCHAVAPAAK